MKTESAGKKCGDKSERSFTVFRLQVYQGLHVSYVLASMTDGAESQVYIFSSPTY